MNTRIGERKNVAPSEEKLLKITGPMGNTMYRLRKTFRSKRILTAEELLRIADVDHSLFTDEVKKVLNTKVSQICRAGSRFTKDCICIQFDEDSDDVMKWAYQKGALLLITRNQIADFPCIVCKNPEKIYAQMCKHFKEMSQARVTAVVGSIGKTTAKRMIHSVYRTEFKTFCDPENENQLDCVGYISQHIPKKAQKLVQEVSEDYAGSVANISHTVCPEIAVITAVDKSHIEQYGSQDGIVNEILSVTDVMSNDGTVILNIDDENLKNISINKRIVTVSIENEDADYYAVNIKVTESGLSFGVFEKATGNTYSVKLSYIYAKHNIVSALYAFAAGVHCGIAYKNIIKGLEKYRTAGIRQNIFKLGKTLIYADCYNAVASSVSSAVEGASNIPVKSRKIAVLGDVEEAGIYSERTHLDMLSAVNTSDFDVLYIYGDKLTNALKQSQLRESLTVICCNNKAEIITSLKKTLRDNDLVLFKASRKSALEDVICGLRPFSYRKQMLKYYLPILKWRLKVIFN